MSLQFGLQPPPAVSADVSSGGRGSMGPAIAVLVVIAVLGVLACVVGRLCSGRTVFGYGHYDLEGWFESKFSSCVDGRVEERPSRDVEAVPETGNAAVLAASAPAAAAATAEE